MKASRAGRRGGNGGNNDPWLVAFGGSGGRGANAHAIYVGSLQRQSGKHQRRVSKVMAVGIVGGGVGSDPPLVVFGGSGGW